MPQDQPVIRSIDLPDGVEVEVGESERTVNGEPRVQRVLLFRKTA